MWVGEAPLQIMLKIQAGRKALRCLWKPEQNIYVRLCGPSLEKEELLVSQLGCFFSPVPSWSHSCPISLIIWSICLLSLQWKFHQHSHRTLLPLQCFPNVQQFARRNFKPFHSFQRWELDHCLPTASCSQNKLSFPLLSLKPIPRNFQTLCVILQSSIPPG